MEVYLFSHLVIHSSLPPAWNCERIVHTLPNQLERTAATCGLPDYSGIFRGHLYALMDELKLEKRISYNE
jgi:hypothetical protein